MKEVRLGSTSQGFGALSLIVFAMVIAVTLMVVMASSRLHSPTGNAKPKFLASALIEQSAVLTSAYAMAYNEAQLGGGVPTFDDAAYGIFNPALTGASLPTPPLDSLSVPAGWKLQKRVQMGNGSSESDIGFELVNVRDEVCAEINLALLGATVLPSVAMNTSQILGPADGATGPAASSHSLGADLTASLSAFFPNGSPTRFCLKGTDANVYVVLAKVL